MDETLVEQIMLYEESELSTKEIVSLFQVLVASGDIWNMPTSYLDVVGRMVLNGHIRFPRVDSQ